MRPRRTGRNGPALSPTRSSPMRSASDGSGRRCEWRRNHPVDSDHDPARHRVARRDHERRPPPAEGRARPPRSAARPGHLRGHPNRGRRSGRRKRYGPGWRRDGGIRRHHRWNRHLASRRRTRRRDRIGRAGRHQQCGEEADCSSAPPHAPRPSSEDLASKLSSRRSHDVPPSAPWRSPLEDACSGGRMLK